MDVALHPALVLWSLGALVQGVLAVWIYRLAPQDWRHRTFSLFLVLNGIWDVLEGLQISSANLATQHLFYRVEVHVSWWTTLTLLAFLGHYPRTRRWAGTRWAFAALMAAAVGKSILMALYPDAVSTVHEGTIRAGPLALVRLWFPLLVVGSVVLLHHAWRRRPEVRDHSLIIVATALVVYPLWTFGRIVFSNDVALSPLAGPTTGSIVAVAATSAYQAATAASPFVLLGALGLAWRLPRMGPRLATTLAIVALVVVLAGSTPLTSGLASIVFAGLTAYALARHRLFDIDVKLRWGISRTTLAAVFIAVFFIASEAAQEFFGETLGSQYVGILAAGALVFVIAPLQRVADRVADKAMPGVKAVGEMTGEERVEAYWQAAVTAWGDGVIDVRERALLDRFRKSLALSEDDAHRIESKAAQEQEGGR